MFLSIPRGGEEFVVDLNGDAPWPWEGVWNATLPFRIWGMGALEQSTRLDPQRGLRIVRVLVHVVVIAVVFVRIHICMFVPC